MHAKVMSEKGMHDLHSMGGGNASRAAAAGG